MTSTFPATTSGEIVSQDPSRRKRCRRDRYGPNDGTVSGVANLRTAHEKSARSRCIKLGCSNLPRHVNFLRFVAVLDIREEVLDLRNPMCFSRRVFADDCDRVSNPVVARRKNIDQSGQGLRAGMKRDGKKELTCILPHRAARLLKCHTTDRSPPHLRRSLQSEDADGLDQASRL